MKLKVDPGWKRAHLVGLGGAGMSAIARILLQAGITVTGSDARESAALESLRTLGVKADVGHRARQAEGADVLIVSAAVPPTNPEVKLAKEKGIPVIWRGEALAQVLEGYRSIGVSGTHGKSTTSGMIATVLASAGENPTFALGADILGEGPGGCLGEGDLAVVEADEAYRSFLWLKPAVSVVTNVDRDHMDHYGGWENLLEAFRTFMENASERVVVCAENPRAMELAAGLNPLTYGFDERAEVQGANYACSTGLSSFDLILNGKSEGSIELKVAGRHNAQNALGALAACLSVGLQLKVIVEGLKKFRGVSRRFEFRGRYEGADLVDDYAHHPAEIEATLSAARWGPWKRLVAVFQPHLYSRTEDLWREFGAALSSADVVVVTDVYGAREEPLPGVTGKLIVDAVCDYAPGRKVAYLPRLNDAARYVREIVVADDLILTLGAGDITTLHERLTEEAEW